VAVVQLQITALCHDVSLLTVWWSLFLFLPTRWCGIPCKMNLLNSTNILTWWSKGVILILELLWNLAFRIYFPIFLILPNHTETLRHLRIRKYPVITLWYVRMSVPVVSRWRVTFDMMRTIYYYVIPSCYLFFTLCIYVSSDPLLTW